MTDDAASVTPALRTKVSTGYDRLNGALGGGVFLGSATLLSAPASSEVPILVRKFLNVPKEVGLVIAGSRSSAEAVVQPNGANVKGLVCSEKPIPPERNMLPGKGVENLTDLNFQITETINSVQPTRAALEILSDVLLRHRALQTRKWLNDLLEKLRTRNITTLAVVNPHMHADEEVQAMVDLFDGNLEIVEKEVGGTLRKFLRINWMQGIDIAEKEFPLLEVGRRTHPVERIAVLPFANISPDPSDEYFADGLTEELIDRLCQVRGLEVIARTSVMTYKKKDKKALEIGRELSVGTLVEGSVRKAGNKIRVTAQLIDANTEKHLWSSRYDRNLDDIFTIQTDIATKIAEALRVNIVGTVAHASEQGETRNLTAYTYFLRARQLLRERGEDSLRQAMRLFERVISLDGSYSRAYVGIAECYIALGDGGYEPFMDCIKNVKEFVQKALSIDEELAEAHAALAQAHWMEDDVRGVELEAGRAVKLNPNLAKGYFWIGGAEVIRGNLDEAVRLAEIAHQLDPLDSEIAIALGNGYLYQGRAVEAMEQLEKTKLLDPVRAYSAMAHCYVSMSNLERAAETIATLEKTDPTRFSTIGWKGYLAALKGERDTAVEMVKLLEKTSKPGAASAINYIGWIHYALGDLDTFFEYMNRAADIHGLMTTNLMYSPMFAKARSDPRMKALFDRIGQPWNATSK